MKRAAIAGLSVLILAAGVWFFLLRDKSKDGEGSEEVETAGKSIAAGKPDRATRRPEGGRAGGRGEVDVLFDDDPVGTLQLEGRVISGGGSDEGVGGAIVSINSNPPRSVRSEADGSFAFAKLVGRDYELVARHERGVAGPLVAKLTETNDPVTLILKPAGAVHVTVVASGSSEPIAGADVELRGIDRQRESTDEAGVARFGLVNADGYEVVASAAGFAPTHERVWVRSAGAALDVRLTLKSGAPVRGQVVSHDGKPVEGARVVYAGASEWLQRASPRWDAAETDAEGRFEFAALPAGTFRFTARARGRAPGSSELVTLDGASATEGVRLTLGEGATLKGRVLSTAGNPVPAARVRITRKDAGFRGNVREAFADDKGNYEIEGLERESLEAVAISADASSSVIPVDFTTSPFNRTVDIALDVEGVIAGVVTDSGGTEIEGAQVWAFPDFRGGNRPMSFALRGVPRVLTDAGGRFKLTGVTDGSYMVRASRSQGGRSGWLLDPTMAKAGDTDVRIELPADGGIKGKVAFASGEAPPAFSVNIGGWGPGTPFASKDGKFELSELAPQKYTITVRGAGFDSKQLVDVEVKPGEIKDLGTVTVKKGRVLIGVVLDQSGAPVADALVRAGRTIFGTGSSSNARGGPPGARNAKEARTNESGEFAIHGLPVSDVSIVAEHETLGRSIAQLIQNGGESVTTMRIQLAPFGSLEGKVVKGGAPVADVRLSVASLSSPDVLFGVASGDDGSFRFDRLAPDEYKVSAMLGNPMQGMGFLAKKVVVESGKTATTTLTLEGGDIELVVKLTEAEGKALNFTWVTAVRGELTSENARDLQLQIGRQPEGYSAQSFSIGGDPATLRDLTAGSYTVCGTPYPSEVTGMSGTMAYMEREGDNLATHCSAVTVTESPANQEAALEVVVPAFVPPPPDES